ncbi:hypothetical protein HYV73_03300 [Candidatus Uhrbacteria bacterium]|nr:hypothetical protein [Candidatus Uhrbacteria bacterium]
MAALVLAFPLLSVVQNDAEALTISPVLVEYEVGPGDAFVGSIRLRNEGKESSTFFTEIQDFEATGVQGAPNFIGKSTTRSLVDWVSFTEKTVTLAPGETKFVTYNISVPRNASPGGYFGGLIFSTSSPVAKQQIGTVAEIATLLLLRVDGAVQETGRITAFSIPKGTYSSLPVDFDIKFQNSGTVHLKPSGAIRVTNFLGGESAALPVNGDGRNVLPNSERVFSAAWQKSALKDDASEFMKEWRNFGFGPYTASLVLHFGAGGQETVSAQTTFWVIPWLLIVLFLILLVAAALLLKQYNRWIVAKAMMSKSKRP